MGLGAINLQEILILFIQYGVAGELHIGPGDDPFFPFIFLFVSGIYGFSVAIIRKDGSFGFVAVSLISPTTMWFGLNKSPFYYKYLNLCKSFVEVVQIEQGSS